MSVIFFIICFFASIIGTICGIGGGILIKPLLDAFNVMDVATINFLSGCTVLSMTTYSVIKSKLSGKSSLNPKTSFPLAIGAATGGLLGKWLFSYLAARSSDLNKIGAIQAICLLIITLGSLIFTVRKSRIRSYRITNLIYCVIIGAVLGIMSSFLGIGGGPVNLVILFFFFSMSTKVAAENSLYIIFFSQLTSLLSSAASEVIPAGNPVSDILLMISKGIPEFPITLLLLMVIGGIAGGVCGRFLNKKLSERTVDKLFISLMLVIVVINIYNIYRFTY